VGPLSFPRADFVAPPAVPAYGAAAGNGWPDPTSPPADQPWIATPPAAAASAPAGPLAGRGPAPAPAAHDAESQARRTPSGLVKRTPRVVDTGEVRAVGRGPNDDLLASLSRYTNGSDITGANPAMTPAEPPPSVPAAAATSAFTAPATAESPFDTPAARPSTGAGLGGGLAAGLSGLSPFQGAPPGTARERGPRPAAAPRAPSPAPAPAPPPAPAPSPAGADGGGATPRGLTRRVRGAQLPNANPLTVRRSPDAAPAPPPRPDARVTAPAGRAAEQTRSADAVYSFLTSFTAGVQRGLDESRPDDANR
jgi:hypothetical protein